MKAYMVWPGGDPQDGVVIVWAYCQNEAKSYVFYHGPWMQQEMEYIWMRARRLKEYDQYAKGSQPHSAELNSDLPEGVTFWDEEDDDDW